MQTRYTFYKNEKTINNFGTGIRVTDGEAFDRIILALGLDYDNIVTLAETAQKIHITHHFFSLEVRPAVIQLQIHAIPLTQVIHPEGGFLNIVEKTLRNNEFGLHYETHGSIDFNEFKKTLTYNFQRKCELESLLTEAKTQARKSAIKNFIKEYAPQEYEKVYEIEKEIRNLGSFYKDKQ